MASWAPLVPHHCFASFLQTILAILKLVFSQNIPTFERKHLRSQFVFKTVTCSCRHMQARVQGHVTDHPAWAQLGLPASMPTSCLTWPPVSKTALSPGLTSHSHPHASDALALSASEGVDSSSGIDTSHLDPMALKTTRKFIINIP